MQAKQINENAGTADGSVRLKADKRRDMDCNPHSGTARQGCLALPNSGGANPPGEPATRYREKGGHSKPQRKRLPHDVPPWVAQGARHFITINCKSRGRHPLLEPGLAKLLLESATFYEHIGHWYLWLMMVMPDHVHFILTFNLQRGIQTTLKAWKSYQCRRSKIKWQSGFFEHRLRNDEEFREKAHYIRWNPVRKQLVRSPEEWALCFDRVHLKEDL